MTSRNRKTLTKNIGQVFAQNQLRVTIEANAKVVNFLDITLDLSRSIYKPYIKENEIPVYVNTASNHPPKILENIPLGINKRLSRISANEEVFNDAVPLYQEALQKSGFNHQLKFNPPDPEKPKKRYRKKEVIWFNPPFSLNLKTNIGKEFLNLVDRAFPKDNPLRKIFNRSTLKIGYKCMPNMAAAISSHNKKILSPTNAESQPKCICGLGPGCPVEGRCSQEWVVYSAKVTETNSGKFETYTGLTKRHFKTRWKEHLRDFENPESRTKSNLCGHIWDLKDRGITYHIEWSIIDRAPPFNTTKRKCLLCLKEKYHIMYNRPKSTLNSRSEVYNTCRHRTQSLLSNL